jgi:hypothetical protein
MAMAAADELLLGMGNLSPRFSLGLLMRKLTSLPLTPLAALGGGRRVKPGQAVQPLPHVVPPSVWEAWPPGAAQQLRGRSPW